jgi:hypothetical protein
MPDFRGVQTSRNDGWVAQLVEQRIENPRVGGSIPPPATKIINKVNHLSTTLSGFFTPISITHLSHTFGIKIDWRFPTKSMTYN